MSVYLYLCLLETLVTSVLILILCLGGAPIHTILKVVDTKYFKEFTDFMYTETLFWLDLVMVFATNSTDIWL